jgi:fumarate hydratase, class I
LHRRRRRGLSGRQGDQGGRVLAFPELGMEAVYEFEVENMPVTVAVDSNGNSVHDSG